MSPRRVPSRIIVDVPSPELSRERIERKLFQALAAGGAPAHEVGRQGPPERGERRRPFLLWAGVATAAAAGIVIAVFWNAPSRRDVAQMTTPAPIATPVDVREPRGSRIITGPGEQSHVSVGDASVEVGESSDIDVRHGARDTLLVLTRGSVDCDVPPRAGRGPFEVAAGHVRVRVLGTRFAVTRHAGRATVEVIRGRVSVTVGKNQWTVSAGEKWSSEPAPAEQPSAPGASTDEADDPPAKTAPSVAPTTLPNPIAGERALAAPAPAAAPTTAQIGTSTTTPAEALRAATTPAARDTATTAISRGDLFNQALSLERRNPARAAAIYRDLAQGSDAWAPIGLFNLAALSHGNGNLSQALEAVTEYERRFPGGAHQQDVAWLRIDALLKLGRRDAAQRAAREYVARFPTGTYAPPAERLLREPAP